MSTSPLLIVPAGPLTPSEKSQLDRCEAVIEKGLKTFYEVGAALAEIRESRLYRIGFATFEDYCRDRWNMSRSRAHRLIDASDVVSNLLPIGNIPSTESQARELVPYEPEVQKAVWEIAQKTAPVNDEGKPQVTAAHIKSVATVLSDIVSSGGLDDGSGEMKPLGVLVDAAVTEETYERLMRQKEHIRQNGKQEKPHVSHNSGENEWYTPVQYVEAARKLMGEIDLDPASTKSANQIIAATTYYSLSNNGLTKEWSGRVWMNPPYAADLVGKFTSKLTEHYLKDDIPEALVLVNNATDTAWFQDMAQYAGGICLLRGRVRFWGPDGQTGAPLQGQVILYFGENQEGFKDQFQEFGLVVWR